MKLKMQDGSRKSTKKQTGEGEGIKRIAVAGEEEEDVGGGGGRGNGSQEVLYKVAAPQFAFARLGKGVEAAMEGLERRWALGWTGAGTTPNPPSIFLASSHPPSGDLASFDRAREKDPGTPDSPTPPSLQRC
ncbi:hypothetical protein CCMA1212_008725 [Trichoderma ghanense]|uniref:Uncharacterized protein n=1 Tax=Trichoderma ghanense TaxID=65468 RepID=A0ABY2GWB2_9HYPO